MTDRPAAAAAPPLTGRRPTGRLRLSPRHRAQIEALLREHLPDVEVWAYGSRVAGGSHDGSDLDLVLRAPDLRKIPIDRLGNLWEALRESTIPFLVEARDWARLPAEFHGEIERDYVVLVERTPAATPADSSCSVQKWPTVTLGDCIEINDSTYSPKEAWPCVNYLDTGNITENRIIDIQHLVAKKDKIPSRARRKVQPGDIIYSTVRPDKRHFGLMKHVPKNLLVSTGFSVIRGKTDRACTDFIYWFLMQDHIIEQLQVIAEHSTSAYPSIKPVDIEQLTLELPPLADQRAIAHVLGALDDKIELNRRMNETLEAMARSLFQSWFVDFDPVRAKMEGRDTGLPKEISDLFPARMVDSEMGLIPEGWRVGSLSEIAVARRRGIDPAELPDDAPYVGLEHMPRRSVALTGWESAGKVSSGKSIFKKGDFLFGKLRPYFHKVGVAPVDGICSTDIAVVAPAASKWRAFTLAVISSTDFVAYTDQTSTGTKMPRTSWKTMADFRLVLPPLALAEQYEESVQPRLERIVTNVHDSKIHQRMRDALLPTLVSGELRLHGDC